MNCNVHVCDKMIFNNKFGFILETSLFLYGVDRHLYNKRLVDMMRSGL